MYSNIKGMPYTTQQFALNVIFSVTIKTDYRGYALHVALRAKNLLLEDVNHICISAKATC